MLEKSNSVLKKFKITKYKNSLDIFSLKTVKTYAKKMHSKKKLVIFLYLALL